MLSDRLRVRACIRIAQDTAGCDRLERYRRPGRNPVGPAKAGPDDPEITNRESQIAPYRISNPESRIPTWTRGRLDRHSACSLWLRRIGHGDPLVPSLLDHARRVPRRLLAAADGDPRRHRYGFAGGERPATPTQRRRPAAGHSVALHRRDAGGRV